MEFLKSGLVEIQFTSKEEEAVQIAIVNLKSDLFKVMNCRVFLHSMDNDVVQAVYGVQNGPCVVSKDTIFQKPFDIRKIIVATRDNFQKLNLSNKKVAKILPNKKEAYVILVEDSTLYLCGNDRRGTIFAIYDFCERLGVSPWYFFADVPPKRRDKFILEEGFCRIDYPSVEYRGIFINDEEELEKWANAYMSEQTIGPKTYAYIFELLLRLRCNYIWPAMHVNSFNANVENGALAEKMGIIVGTSHCDMLMRSNNREWEPWKKSKGYDNLVYDFSIEGENRERLKEYWRESVIQNKDFEVTYTLGMRGIHDSGFHTEALKGLTGEELLQGKIKLLSDVFATQDQILNEIPHKEALKLFVPYKEVLELYDNGLAVPEDYTLIWTNDNYGYVRRYPDETARARKGGNGIYYHQSYWAPPEGSYLFICSTPAAHTRNELLKAYENGINKLWVTNFGAIKPLEQQLSFYAALAWNVGKQDDPTIDVEGFLADWLDRTFTGNYGKELAPLLTVFDQIVNMRKIELMDNGVFYQSEKADEASGRIHVLRNVFEKTNEIYEKIPQEEKDAFFQMIMLKVHAAYYTNAMYYFADRSIIMTEMSQDKEAEKCVKIAEEYDTARQALIYYYNHVMSNGKWNGIVTPEDFPPPRTAMYPASASKNLFFEKTGFYPAHVYHMADKEEPKSRITREATSAIEYESIEDLQQKLPIIISHLGRGVGSLVEYETADSSLSYEFEVEEAGEYWLSIERFPSLNSVGEIKIDYCVDEISKGTIYSTATDEHRGNWKRNILNNVDFLTVKIGYLSAGLHTLQLGNASKYFAFSRIHIHDREITGNHFWHEEGMNEYLDQKKFPEAIDFKKVHGEFYKNVVPQKRPELFIPLNYTDNSLINEDIYADDERNIFGKDSIRIVVADALRENADAGTFGVSPDYCMGIGRDRIGLYYRDEAALMKHEKNGVRYHFSSEEGEYTLWICMYTKGNEEYCFEVEVDQEKLIGSQENARKLWRYSSENVYKWIPIRTMNLLKGKHEISFTFLKSRLRLEGICLQKRK